MKAIDEAIKIVNTKDSAASDFQNAIRMINQVEGIVKKYSRKIDANALFNHLDMMRNKFQYYIDNSSRGWYD